MFEPDQLGQDRLDLAEALRTLRRASGLSGERLAARTHMSQAKISRIETGRVAPTILDVERILHALDIPSGEAAELLDLAKLANIEFQGDRETLRRGVTHRHRDLAAYEQKSTTIRYVLPIMLTGLLQTPEYLYHTSRTIIGEQAPRSREEIVARRLERQQVLFNAGKHILFLLTEAAVRCRMIAAPAMAVQVDRLVSLSMMSNLDIEVIPLSRQVDWTPLNVFVIYDDRLVTIETEAGLVLLRDPQDIQYHLELFEVLRAGALKGDECREFLRGIADEFRRVSS